MNDAVRRIADAVLYEGHMLFPYRPSALKNQQRWTFGGVYPGAYDRPRVWFEALAEGEAPRFDVEVRFLRGDEERSVRPGPIDDPPGRVEMEVTRHGALHRLRVAIENQSPWSGSDRNEAMRHTYGSAHAIARVQGGAFLPPLECELDNEGLWPVLVGEAPDRTAVLAAPIILPDYPQVAPESAGDFFDSTEIDELLTLRIMTLTDEEKREMRAVDEHARQILERTEAVELEHITRLHGAVRGLRLPEEENQ
jgi:hypothetical protein